MERMFHTSEGLKPESWLDEREVFKSSTECIICGEEIYGTPGKLSTMVPICPECRKHKEGKE